MGDQRLETHFADWLRVGVLGEGEEAKLRFVPHLMDCARCQERLSAVLEEMSQPEAPAEAISCERARHSLFQYLDLNKQLPPAVFGHLRRCEDCYDHFVEPARSLSVRESGETPEIG